MYVMLPFISVSPSSSLFTLTFLLSVAFPKDKMASGTNRVTIAKGHANTVAIGHIQRIRRLLTPHIQGKVTPLTQDDFPVWTVVSVLEICLMSFRV